MKDWTEYVKNLLLYLLFVSLLLTLLRDSVYERYVKTVCGMLFLLLLAKPLLPFLSDGQELLPKLWQRLSFADAWSEAKTPTLEDDIMNDTILKAYKEELTNELEEALQGMGLYLLEARYVCSDELASFGSICQVTILAKEQASADTEGKRIVIRPVMIGTQERRTPSARELSVQEAVAAMYGIPSDAVRVQIWEDG